MSTLAPQPDFKLSPPSPIPTAAAAVLLFCFIIAIFILCVFKWYISRRQNALEPSDTSGPKPNTGLDSTSLMAFPTLIYSNVKHLRRENHHLECAICLYEFEDDSVLKLLTVCYHVFHQDCIDAWLVGHTSCPVCRASLDLPPEKILERLPQILRDPILSDVQKPSGDGPVSKDAEKGETAVSIKMANQQSSTKPYESYRRWHTTGHSIVQTRSEGDCRYTLRLPENSKVRVTKGCYGQRITFEDASNHDNTVCSSEVLEAGSRRTTVARSLSLGPT